MEIVAIIQARLNSSRLFHKSMQLIEGKPILEHVVRRTQKAIAHVIVATPDTVIAECATVLGIDSFVGSENDVLDRYYQATKFYKVTDIVRITADNPLLDPGITKKVLNLYQKGDYDYVSNNLKRTYPLGLDVEVFSFKALERAWDEGKSPAEREHVTPYIKNHAELFRLGNVENDIDLSHLRWTVDTMEDLEFARKVYSKLGGNFNMKDVLALKDKEEQI